MEYVKGRTVSPGDRVKVYVNLHQQGRFSIVGKDGLVAAYASSVLLQDIKLHVGESGRQKIILHKRKAVHAWATGTLVSMEEEHPEDLQREVYYEPYNYKYFTAMDNGEPITMAHIGYFRNKRIYISYEERGLV